MGITDRAAARWERRRLYESEEQWLEANRVASMQIDVLEEIEKRRAWFVSVLAVDGLGVDGVRMLREFEKLCYAHGIAVAERHSR